MDMMSLRRIVLVNQNKLMTATGNPLMFNTPLAKPLKECVARFTPQQEGSGTPSPENVRPIVGKNGITVWQSGKNLCPETTDTDYWSINGYMKSNGTIVLNNVYRMCDYRRAKPNTDYSFSSQISGWKGIGFYDSDFKPIGFLQEASVSITLTSPSNAEYYRIYCSSSLPNLQFEIGSTPTEYEAYALVEASVSFPAVGKNLFDGEWRKGRYVNGVWTTTNTWRTSELIPVEPNTTYCVSVNEPRTIAKIYCNLFDRNGNWIGSDYGTSVTTTADTALMTICNTNNVVSAWTDIQLEKGSTATAYEPFDNTIYGGYVDLVAGEVVAEWTKVDMGELSWGIAWNTFATNPTDHANNNVSNTPSEIMCDIYPSDTNITATAVSKVDKNIRGRANYKHICIRDDDYATAADFKTAVTGHYLAYKLAEHIHYPLTPQSITTLKGQNVMWSDANGDLTVKYWTR